MKRFCAALLVVMLLCFAFMASADTVETVLPEENFNNGLPENWSLASSGGYNWAFSEWSQGQYAYEGKSAFAEGTWNEGAKAYLVLPTVDLTKYDDAAITFMYKQEGWGDDQNVLSIFYRVDDGEPIQLWTAGAVSVPEWTQATVSLAPLTEASMKGHTVKVAFCNTNDYGYATGVDNVSVTGTIVTPTAPATGDTTPVEMLTILAAISAVGVIALLLSKKRNHTV